MARLIPSLLLVVLAAAAAATSVSGQSAASLGAANDLVVLNYALTLENLEAAFYNQGLGTNGVAGVFNATSFPVAAGYPANTFSYLQMIQSHENQHVAFLTAAINGAQAGAAVPACTYNFSSAMTSPAAFLATAAALENGGQSAYDGAINGITDPAYAQAAATIATVEARHAAYLNELQQPVYGTSPFPNAFDTANTPQNITQVVAPFIVNCSYNITLPAVRPSGVTLSSSGAVTKTGSSQLSTSYTAPQQSNDITALNYALTLEHLEAAFYNYILATFNATAFAAANLPSYYYNYTQMIAAHENLHVSTLTTVINGRLAGAAVPNCTYNFTGITSLTGAYPSSYLGVAFVLENTGVMAYDGAVNTITDTALQQVAATIATVEARHAAFLNQAYNSTTLGQGLPFPSAYDNATGPAGIISAVLGTGLVVGCPYNITTPTVIASQATYVGTGNANVGSTGSSSSSSSSGQGNNGAASLHQLPSFVLHAALALLFVLAAASL